MFKWIKRKSLGLFRHKQNKVKNKRSIWNELPSIEDMFLRHIINYVSECHATGHECVLDGDCSLEIIEKLQAKGYAIDKVKKGHLCYYTVEEWEDLKL